jgi:DNA-binding XRE family transcriptional regulator
MSASKNSHVLSVLRKNLALRQSELAEMLGCAKATITSIEVGRLKLSESLADRIVAVTGCDRDWLLANDITVPMPSQAIDSDVKVLPRGHFRRSNIPKPTYVYTMYLLTDLFSRLFAEVRKLEKTSIRNELEDHIRKELSVLEKTQTDANARPLYSMSKDAFEYFERYSKELPPELLNLGLDFKHLIETSPERPL